MSFADECTRLYTPNGRVAHLQAPTRSLADVKVVLCPQGWPLPSGWLGTGSQAEYDKAASLPTCRLCERAANGEDARYAKRSQSSEDLQAPASVSPAGAGQDGAEDHLAPAPGGVPRIAPGSAPDMPVYPVPAGAPARLPSIPAPWNEGRRAPSTPADCAEGQQSAGLVGGEAGAFQAALLPLALGGGPPPARGVLPDSTLLSGGPACPFPAPHSGDGHAQSSPLPKAPPTRAASGGGALGGGPGWRCADALAGAPPEVPASSACGAPGAGGSVPGATAGTPSVTGAGGVPASEASPPPGDNSSLPPERGGGTMGGTEGAVPSGTDPAGGDAQDAAPLAGQQGLRGKAAMDAVRKAKAGLAKRQRNQRARPWTAKRQPGQDNGPGMIRRQP